MQNGFPKRGRPSGERLAPADAKRLKDQLIEDYGSLARFYEAALEAAKQPKYKGLPQPSDLRTVSRTFAAALSGDRPLPNLYWKVLKELLGIAREDFLPQAATLTPTVSPAEVTLAPHEVKVVPAASGSATVTSPRPSETNIAAPPVPQAASPGNTSSAPPSVSHPVTSTSAEPTTSPQPTKKTTSPRPKRHRKGVRRRNVKRPPAEMPPRGNRSLADWFRGFSLREITRYINAAACEPTWNEIRAIKEVLEAECINVIAEKLALADYQDYFEFYANPYGQVPDQLKCAVSKVIVSDSELRRSWVGNMESGKTPDRIGVWLAHVSRFYPNEFLRRMDKLLVVDIDFDLGPKNIKDFDLFYITGMIWFCRTLGLEGSALALTNTCLRGNLDFLRNALQGRHDQSVLLFFWKETRKSMSDDTRKRVKTFFKQVLRPRAEKAPGKYKCFPPTAYDQAFVNIGWLLRAEHLIQ